MSDEPTLSNRQPEPTAIDGHDIAANEAARRTRLLCPPGHRALLLSASQCGWTREPRLDRGPAQAWERPDGSIQFVVTNDPDPVVAIRHESVPGRA